MRIPTGLGMPVAAVVGAPPDPGPAEPGAGPERYASRSALPGPAGPDATPTSLVLPWRLGLHVHPGEDATQPSEQPPVPPPRSSMVEGTRTSRTSGQAAGRAVRSHAPSELPFDLPLLGLDVLGSEPVLDAGSCGRGDGLWPASTDARIVTRRRNPNRRPQPRPSAGVRPVHRRPAAGRLKDPPRHARRPWASGRIATAAGSPTDQPAPAPRCRFGGSPGCTWPRS
jgi:hypothetical protein